MINKKSKHFYPVTPQTLENYARLVFEPIKRGENVTTIWVPMSGRRTWTKFVISNIDLFKRVLPDPEKYLLVYVDPLDLTEESLLGYIRLMAISFINVCQQNRRLASSFEKDKAFFKDESIKYARLLEKLRELVKKAIDNGLEVVFFLGEFDELFFANKILNNNLKSLWSFLSPSLHFVFLMRENIVDSSLIKKFYELAETVLQNIVFVPLLTAKDVDHLISLNEKAIGVVFSPQEKKAMVQVCGPHPFLLKTACRAAAKIKGRKKQVNELERILAGNYELRSASSVIWEVLTEKEKEFVSSVVHSRVSEIPFERESLKILGLIREEKGRVVVFNKLLTDYIQAGGSKKRMPSPSLTEKNGQEFSIEEETEIVLLNGKPIEEYLSRQEDNVLTMLIKKKGRLCTRDDIGGALWGEDSYEKYSDWAIDQLISKLRKKLKQLGVKDGLKTIRGRGYKLIAG